MQPERRKPKAQLLAVLLDCSVRHQRLLPNPFTLALGVEALLIRLQVLIDDRVATIFVFPSIHRIDLQLANLPTDGRT